MAIEFIGMIHHRHGSEIHPPGPLIFDRGYVRDFAQAAEAASFDRVLVGYFSDGPDGFLLSAYAAAHTERLGFLLAHRPGFVAPTLAARKFATLDQVTGGRAAIHVISGGDDVDQLRDGDTLPKDERYARTDEYVHILKRIWTETGPVDHAGRYYSFVGASTAMRCVQQPRIPIYFGGASDAAIAAAGKHADVYALWGETHEQVRELTARVRAAAAQHGREVRFSLSFRPILAPTEDEAWARAEQIKQRIIELRAKAGAGPREPANEGSRRLLAAAAQGERLDKRLWTGAARLTGARGNTTSLVGTPQQVAEALCDYHDLGVTTFLIRGFDPLDDAIEYGRSLLPLTRQMIDQRTRRVTHTPLLGKAVRHEWALDPDFLSVNHGSFGATPRVVLAAQREWQQRMEAQPSRFMRAVLPEALRHAADRLGAFIGADGEDVAFVENATTGCNAVLRSLRLAPGDQIVVLSHGYGAVRNTVRHVCEHSGASVVEASVPFPHPDADAIIANIAAALTPRTKLAVVDHITSASALVLPLRRIVDVCHAAGVPVLVDGAHGPAQVPLDMRACGADWYAGNCHKWLCAPKGSAFLYARPDRQADLHPVTISHGLGRGFLEEFDWTGTRDPSAWLATDVAIDFHARFGGEALMARNIALAADATSLLARRLNTDPSATGAMAGCMGVVRLPLSGTVTAERSTDLRARLLAAGTDAPTHVQAGAIWLRLSAAAYNDIEDYQRLAEIVARVVS